MPKGSSLSHFSLYDNYIFDLYGTLIDIRTDESKPFLWKRLAWLYGFYGANYTDKEIFEQYHTLCKVETQKPSSFKVPEIDLEKVFLQLFINKGISVTKETILEVGHFFRIESTSLFHLYDGVKDLLSALKEDGKKLFVLSNAQHIFTWYEIVSLGLLPYFDAIYLSSDCHCAKPDPAFYEKLIVEQKLDKSKTIMIGNDCKSDILGATKAGLDTLYIDTEISPPIEEPFNPTFIAEKENFSSILKILSSK